MLSEAESFDVVVIGAGLGGLQCARLLARAGVVWSPATRYVGCELKADGGVAVELEVEGRSVRVPARFLVGADGAQSRVARDLRLDANREWLVGVEDVYRDVPLAGAPRF